MIRKSLAAIAVSAFFAMPAHALIIDDFSVTQSLSDPGTAIGFVTGAPGSIIGGERDAEVNQLTGADPATLSFNAGSNGTMSIANGTGGTSLSTVIWDGGDASIGLNATGLGGIDLTVGGTQDALDLRVVANDFAADILIRVYTDGANWSSLTLSSPGGIPGPASIPFLFEYASFTAEAGTGADFANVGAILLFVNAYQNATDIELDFFETTTTEVPEPGALAVMGIALAGLGIARRRRA